MEWWVLFALVLVGGVVLASFADRKKQKKQEHESSAYAQGIDHAKQKLLSGSSTASLPVLDAIEFDYRLVGKERLISVQDGVTRMEMKTTGRYRTGGASVSIPIVKGVRFRVGSGSIKSEKQWLSTAEGRLLVTDKAVVFEGDAKNERITWTQVSDIEIMFDGYEIRKRTGPPRTYLVDRPDPEFAAIVELMLLRTG